jgi:hypothetical protein
LAGAPAGREVRFAVHVRNNKRDSTPTLAQLKALCGLDDDGAVSDCLAVG